MVATETTFHRSISFLYPFLKTYIKEKQDELIKFNVSILFHLFYIFLPFYSKYLLIELETSLKYFLQHTFFHSFSSLLAP